MPATRRACCATGARVDVAASACTHASVATSNALPSGLNSSQRIGCDQCRAVPSTSPSAVATSTMVPSAVPTASRRRRARMPMMSRPHRAARSYARALRRERRDDDGARRVADGNSRSIRREHQCRHGALRLHLGHHAPVRDRRDTDGARRGARDVPTVGAERHDRHGCVRRLHDGSGRRARRKIPHAHDAVVAARRRETAVAAQGRSRNGAAMTEERQRRARCRRGSRTDLQVGRWPSRRRARRSPSRARAPSAPRRPSPTADVTDLARQPPRLERRRTQRDELRAVGRQLRARHGHGARDPQPVKLDAGRDVEHGDGAVVARECEPPPVGRSADARGRQPCARAAARAPRLPTRAAMTRSRPPDRRSAARRRRSSARAARRRAHAASV